MSDPRFHFQRPKLSPSPTLEIEKSASRLVWLSCFVKEPSSSCFLKDHHLSNALARDFTQLSRQPITKDPQMAEEPGHPTQTAQHGEDANEEIVERNELLKEAIDGPGDPGKASSNHSRPRHETSRPEENQSDRTTPPCSPKTHASPQTFRCWYEGIESSEIKDFIYGELACLLIRWHMSL